MNQHTLYNKLLTKQSKIYLSNKLIFFISQYDIDTLPELNLTLNFDPEIFSLQHPSPVQSASHSLFLSRRPLPHKPLPESDAS